MPRQFLQENQRLQVSYQPLPVSLCTIITFYLSALHLLASMSQSLSICLSALVSQPLSLSASQSLSLSASQSLSLSVSQPLSLSTSIPVSQGPGRDGVSPGLRADKTDQWHGGNAQAWSKQIRLQQQHVEQKTHRNGQFDQNECNASNIRGAASEKLCTEQVAEPVRSPNAKDESNKSRATNEQTWQGVEANGKDERKRLRVESG